MKKLNSSTMVASACAKRRQMIGIEVEFLNVMQICFISLYTRVNSSISQKICMNAFMIVCENVDACVRVCAYRHIEIFHLFHHIRYSIYTLCLKYRLIQYDMVVGIRFCNGFCGMLSPISLHSHTVPIPFI